MPWDFSIYPEMTDAQKSATFTTGITLQGVQGVEQILGFCLRLVFPTDPSLSLAALYTMDAGSRKRTLGQLVVELRKRVEVQSDFDAMLREFVELRNRFVHHLFNERDCTLATDESCTRAVEVMRRLQLLTWDIQNILMAYNLLWVQHSGIPEFDAVSERNISQSKHLEQVRENFVHVLRPRLPKA
jgi:hypothetical protein